jgi:hypothetical protein
VVLGNRRHGDVAGAEIPARYFSFVRSGDARPLVAVLEHNRRDLLSLAALTVQLLHLIDAGPDAAGSAQEALALGRTYQRSGLGARAIAAFERALHLSVRAGPRTPVIALQAHRALAVIARRYRLHDEAARRWQQLLEVPACPSHIAREALEALAIHHEHRLRDLSAAKAFALRSLGQVGPVGPAENRSARALRQRLARLERKMTSTTARAGAAEARLDLTD